MREGGEGGGFLGVWVDGFEPEDGVGGGGGEGGFFGFGFLGAWAMGS